MILGIEKIVLDVSFLNLINMSDFVLVVCCRCSRVRLCNVQLFSFLSLLVSTSCNIWWLLLIEIENTFLK